MKRKQWTDNDGRLRAVLLPPGCPDDRPELGVPSEPPDIDRLDWVAIRRDLHNGLIETGLLTWIDVQQSQDLLTSICRRVLIRPLINLYRNEGGSANE